MTPTHNKRKTDREDYKPTILQTHPGKVAIGSSGATAIIVTVIMTLFPNGIKFEDTTALIAAQQKQSSDLVELTRQVQSNAMAIAVLTSEATGRKERINKIEDILEYLTQIRKERTQSARPDKRTFAKQ